MRKTTFTDEDLKDMRQSIVLLHGVFEDSFFDMIAQRECRKVFVMEGRPSMEAARVNTKALLKRDITPTLISDNMAGFLFYHGLVKEAWLAYAITEKRGAMCFIGASVVALLAKEHNVPLFCYQGEDQAQEIAAPEALKTFQGKRIAPRDTKVYAPLWEWVPGKCFIIDQNYQELQS
jgi:methylthioribose-1-phosphate isomerase